MALPAKDGPIERRKLDRYEIIAEIASGGMGTVYLARLEGAGGFQRLFAIKLMHAHLAKEPQFVAMLLDEARIAARIHHPNAVGIVDVCNSDAGYYLVMQYVEGFTLDDVLDHPELTRRDKIRLGLRILYDAAVGLHSAHELVDDDGESLHLVHRDVSPQNILVGVDGVSRITDFGVARAAARITSSRPGMIKGKPCYMAPEQALGKDLNRRADVFALGIILWEILVGEMLFYSEAGDAAMLARVLYDEVRSPRDIEDTVTEGLEAVVMKALDRDPTERHQTAREFAEALEEAAREDDLIATTHQLGDRLQESFKEAVKARRASIQKHIAELGTGSTPIASDVYEQIPKLEQRPSYLAPAPDSGAWHEMTDEGQEGVDGSADTRSAMESAPAPANETRVATPRAKAVEAVATVSTSDAATEPKKQSPWLAIAGVVMVLLGVGAWFVASAASEREAQEVQEAREAEAAAEATDRAAEEANAEASREAEAAAAREAEAAAETARDLAEARAAGAAAQVEAQEATEAQAAAAAQAQAQASADAEERARAHREARASMDMGMTTAMGIVVETNPYLHQ
ncbi:MAG: hypothetical protein DRJ42_22265 [Deltaproteobacteria bacterium]|nr:MAG: hypothetical protein DRJ42_22265 [Deltaproteobacteria bacterium]